MKPEIIIMLTHHDVTVKDAGEIFEQCKDLPVKFWGFKNVGLPKDETLKTIEAYNGYCDAGVDEEFGKRKELLLPLLCGIFLVESLSVMLQVSYFKYTKRKYGEGRRILLMSPLHHHYQKQGFFETKIVTRFWIVSLLLAAITLVTLKIR